MNRSQVTALGEEAPLFSEAHELGPALQIAADNSEMIWCLSPADVSLPSSCTSSRRSSVVFRPLMILQAETGDEPSGASDFAHQWSPVPMTATVRPERWMSLPLEEVSQGLSRDSPVLMEVSSGVDVLVVDIDQDKVPTSTQRPYVNIMLGEDLDKLLDPVPIAVDDILQIATAGAVEKPLIPTQVSTATVLSVTPLSFIRSMSERRASLKLTCKDDSSLRRRDVSTPAGWASHKDNVTMFLSRPKSIVAQSILC
ncbi:uncharacterized protein LOC142502516 [Ascaphus truei]|uniref:uncharacterized protein LOC142502516 n=1 Tax=Ascaphus truei TaxID=8439 RepID=UPI003F5AC23F